MKTETMPLKKEWDDLRAREPQLRIRDAAARLGVTEVELLATRCGEGVTRLAGDWSALIKEFPRLGRVLCLTRNEAAVHERYGEFRAIDFFHGMGQVVGPDIDLRLFMHQWHSGFAVTDVTAEGERQSFQFFNKHGVAVHKVFLERESNFGCYGELLHRFRSENQSATEIVEPPVIPQAPLPDAEIDVAGFHQAWGEMKDTHAFFGLLKKFQLAREQALRLTPEGFAVRLSSADPRLLLEAAAQSGQPIMIFVGSPGCIQIHTGPIVNIKPFGADWINVLDDEFSLHLFLPLLSSVWLVRKPTTDGIVTSIELYDASGENIALIFGQRKPGQPESEAWRNLASQLAAKD